MCRASILGMLGLNGDEDTIAEAQKRFQAHLDGNFIHADLRSSV